MKAYPAYKPSGVEWVGGVPEGWALTPLKHIATFENGAAFKPESWSDTGTPIIRIENLNGSEKFNCYEGEMPSKYKVRFGDILFGWSGNRGTSFGPFRWTKFGDFYLNQHIFNVVDFSCQRDWLYWCLLAVTAYVEQQAHGIIGMVHITKGDLGKIPVPVPTNEEQRAIAAFLDREVAKIDGLIEEQRRLIALLAEKRQATISHAVTKGMNPHAKLKPSGIDWLGDVPEGWDVVPLKFVTKSKCDGPFGSGLKSEHYTESGVRVIRLQNIRFGSFNSSDAAYVDEAYANESLKGHEVATGDLLIAGLGDDKNPVGRACVAPSNIEPAMVKADCFRFRLDGDQVVSQFAAHQLSVAAFRDSKVLATGTTRSRIPLSVMASRILALPTVSEQLTILADLNSKLDEFDELRALATNSVELLQERRSALISAAVTGKIDVRDLAPDMMEPA